MDYPPPGTLSVMTHGQGYDPPGGWPPPSDREPTLYGRRRAAEDELDGEPVESPYQPRRAADAEQPPPGERHVPRPSGTARVPSPTPPRPDWSERPERPAGRDPIPPPAQYPAPPTQHSGPPQPHPHPQPNGNYPPPPPHLAGSHPGAFPGGLVPVEPMERTSWPGRGTAPVPQQWGAPGDEPVIDLPDRRRRVGTYDRTARHGQSAPPPPRPKAAPWQTALGLVAVAVLVAVCAAGGYFMFTDRGPAGSAAADGIPAGPKPHDISNRRADPTPLSEAEVFPAPTVATGYQVLKTQTLTDCKGAAVGQPVQMLAVQDCTQVVRAALTSADGAYVVTAGLFNFGTQVNAQQASDSIRDSVGAQKGRFTGYNLGSRPSDVYARAATQLGWDVRGHFLAYCVIARADSQPIAGTDQTAHGIIDELVEKYLIGTVLQARVSPPTTGSAPASGK